MRQLGSRQVRHYAEMTKGRTTPSSSIIGIPRSHLAPTEMVRASGADLLWHRGHPRLQALQGGQGNTGSREQLTRRTILLHSSALPAFLLSLTIGSDDPTTLLNSVLAGYGLPKLPGSTGFKVLDDFELDFTLEYPRSWVVRPNTLRQGVYISDFNTADKLTVEVLPLAATGSSGDLVAAAVAAAVVPGAGLGQQDDKLLLPPASRVKSRTELVDGKEYTYLEFPSETVTRSGYQVRRRNFAAAVVKGGRLYTLNASARSDQFNKEKEALLRHVVESFRVR
ncbi:hypothetical protein VOLCADRAFT_127349 [Volvox carteri f. nagariensis]|uniref:PsbP C-terminal domain-containing protein n=1 Tax=Volvox carteri f. nagariensis TaxID=3068 RepID=D8THP0_VOLCA|nr:uncharacterized protein VOLCADRAFT_127349 [Volvox carteri f. nagariensis]EFJ53101.1 hypothetical protein VOLCADRAFT_127349 [Volvox carteri f. nagariensis]|eukprot:XP_002946106.1 hypothetical protein VOLCADRAFT_127349 [Volvox carteri f. nagariensis]